MKRRWRPWAVGLLLGGRRTKDDPAVKGGREVNRRPERGVHARDAGKVKGLMTEDHVAVTSYYAGRWTGTDSFKSLQTTS